MKIVLLDAFTINPGDLSWDELKSLGPCEIYERTLPEEVVKRAANSEILLTNKTIIAREHMEKLPLLKYIGVLATGTNVVDLAAARERGIPVTNVPNYSTQSVAQTTFALLLELTQRAGYHDRTVREGRWTRNIDWCYWDSELIELDGRTIGIVGFGRIGQAVARLADAFGMKVLAYSPRPKPVPPYVRLSDLETLLRESDVVSLHCPLTNENRNLINAERISWMKPGALLINTARGLLVDDAALAQALESGRLGGAGLDVLSAEPPPASNPLLLAKNCVITPHLSWGTRACRERLVKAAVENIRAFLSSKLRNVVNAGC